MRPEFGTDWGSRRSIRLGLGYIPDSHHGRLHPFIEAARTVSHVLSLGCSISTILNKSVLIHVEWIIMTSAHLLTSGFRERERERDTLAALHYITVYRLCVNDNDSLRRSVAHRIPCLNRLMESTAGRGRVRERRRGDGRGGGDSFSPWGQCHCFFLFTFSIFTFTSLHL